jgi:hypothetical protein
MREGAHALQSPSAHTPDNAKRLSRNGPACPVPMTIASYAAIDPAIASACTEMRRQTLGGNDCKRSLAVATTRSPGERLGGSRRFVIMNANFASVNVSPA